MITEGCREMKKTSLLILLLAGLVISLSGCSFFNRGPDIQNWQPGSSPEGDKIVFSSKVGKKFELFTLDPDTGGKTQLTNNDFDDWGPDWGPKGERIVFVSRRDDNTDIYMIDVDTGDELRLTTDSNQDVNPKWSSADSVVFNSDRTGSWEIFEISVESNKVTQLTFASESS